MQNTTTDQLLEQAKQAQSYAQARFSNFKVGAAILTKEGKIFTGCNIESTSYGLTICAERVALAKALSEGYTRFESLAIIGPGEDLCSPCGACRQLLYDYAPDIDIILIKKNKVQIYPLKDLLPLAFEENRLKNK